MISAQDLIAALGLKPLLPEGGYYRETYRSEDELPAGAVAGRFRQGRAVASAIYYLLTADTFSALHRLPADEIYHFYLGDPVVMLQLLPSDEGRFSTLGTEVLRGQSPQVIVPAGTWQGSYLVPGGNFALLGATMAPAFDFSDYEPADRDELLARYPAFADEIARLTIRITGQDSDGGGPAKASSNIQ
ncbi:MAG TPA: cupin domain-containing protein [Gemmataceae bacterium]|jgi:predicted cupin superfamily sugar epimerase|nr:cupin domain-containing protein [Gemmataceae bacterium]